MTRRINVPCPKAPNAITISHPGTKRFDCAIEVITPVFGGGVEAGTNDPITLIRPSSIRGHLRFWWRATRGSSYANASDLSQREAEIWGSTENPSPVSLGVKLIKHTTSKSCAYYELDSEQHLGVGEYHLKWCEPFAKRGSPLPYVLFPFQGTSPYSKERKDPAKYVASASFVLEVSFPTPDRMAKLSADYKKRIKKAKLPDNAEQDHDIHQDIEAAIWAWVNFGGIGARTRRGCGALFCKDFAPSRVDRIGEWFQSFSKSLVLGERSSENQWPTLIQPPLVMNQITDTLEAWSQAVKLMRDFRQGSVGRDRRSLWPEADSLRAITRNGKFRHLTSKTLPEPIDPKSDTAFPRSELGLPIVFHFKDSADSPNDSELYPQNHQRMASPVILRPLAIGNGKQALPMVLQLTGPRPQALELKGLENPPVLTSRNISRPDLGYYPGSPLQGSAEGSALNAFLDFAREKGCKEIKS